MPYTCSCDLCDVFDTMTDIHTGPTYLRALESVVRHRNYACEEFQRYAKKIIVYYKRQLKIGGYA